MKFRYLILIAVVCGLAIGAGLHIALDMVRVCTQDPAAIGEPLTASCHGLSVGVKMNAAMLIIAFGAVFGIILRSPQFQGLAHAIARKIERKHEEQEIVEYFTKDGGGRR
jgi:H+/gluconate symporter-like permease